jgi:hypothetical protein
LTVNPAINRANCIQSRRNFIHLPGRIASAGRDKGGIPAGLLRAASAEQARMAGGPIQRDRWAAPCAPGINRYQIETTESGIANITRRLTDCCKHVTGACTLLDKVGGE